MSFNGFDFLIPLQPLQYLRSSFLGGFSNFLSLFHAYHPSEISYEVEIRYVYLVVSPNVPFGGFDLSVPLQPSQPQSSSFLGGLFYFISFFTHISLPK